VVSVPLLLASHEIARSEVDAVLAVLVVQLRGDRPDPTLAILDALAPAEVAELLPAHGLPGPLLVAHECQP
jgi:hypothetical protein